MNSAIDLRSGRTESQILATVVDASPALMTYWSRDLICGFANRAFCRWIGLPASSVVGSHLQTLVGEDLATKSWPLIEAVLGGQSRDVELSVPKPDGGAVLHTLASFVPDVVGGEVVGFIVHSTDVTMLKEAQDALRAEIHERQRANRLIRAGIEALEEAQRLGQLGSWAWEAESDTTHWSRELYRIMGLDPSQPAPSFAVHAQLYRRESWARLERAVAMAMNAGTSYRMDLEYIQPNGSTGWLEARGEPVIDDQNRIVGLRGTVQCINPPATSRQIE